MRSAIALREADTRPPPAGDTWATPWDVFRPLHRRFDFTVDGAALLENAKLPRFWSPAEDGLRQEWAGERVWLNPPYSDIRPWIQRAVYEQPDLAVFLLPARVGSDWFHEYVWDGDRPRPGFKVEPLRGRVRFEGAKKLPSWDSMLVIYE